MWLKQRSNKQANLCRSEMHVVRSPPPYILAFPPLFNKRMKRYEGQQLRPLILQAWSSLARHYMAVSTAISERLAYPSMCCTLNTKKLCEKFASSGRIFLHKRFLKLWEIALKKVSCQPHIV